MKRFHPLLLVLLCACGGPTASSIGDDTREAAGELAAIYAKITDEASAKAHKDELKRLARELREYGEQWEKLGKNDPDARQAVNEAMQQVMASEEQVRLGQEAARLSQNQAVWAIVEQAMQPGG